MFDAADFKMGFWIMSGVLAALVLVSLIMHIFGGKVTGG